MILVDTDVLSAMAKIGRLPLLFLLLKTTELHVTPGVFEELEHSSNESRVAHCCRQYEVPCFRLPDILRALWLENIVSKEEVQDIVRDVQAKDRMRFKQSILDAIFADKY